MSIQDGPATAPPPVMPAQPPSPAPHPSPPASLRDRVPGQAVITTLLEQQAAVRPRSRLMRLLGQTPLSAETAPWYLGALGEIEVGQVLAQLGAGRHVLHSVPVSSGDSDIDHIVIGPAGVVTLNTKHHAGQSVWIAGRTFLVAGQKQPYIRNAEHEAQRAGRRLTAQLGYPVPVTPLVVLVDPKTVTVKEKPEQVVVLPATQLTRWLKRRPPVLTPAQVQDVLAVAERPSTWHDHPSAPADTTALRQAFAALHATVRRARLVRATWPLVAAGAGGLGALTVGPDLLSQLMASLTT